MSLNSFSKKTLGVLALGLMSTAAFAYQPGEIIVRGGAANVSPDEDSSEIALNGVALGGTSVEVDDDTQLGLSATYMFSDRLGIELLAATPFTHTVTGKAVPVGNVTVDSVPVAEVTHLPPTVSAQFFPMGADSPIQPYVGVGLNYTIFFDEELDSQFVGALGDGDISLDNSVGIAFEAGIDIALDEKWVLNAAIWKVDIDTEANIKLDNGARLSVDVDIDPVVYMLAVGYRF